MNMSKRPAIRFTIYTDEWNQQKVSDIAPLQRGFDLPVSQMKSGQFPVVMSNGIGGYHNDFKVKGPGVVTGRSGTIGKLHYIDKDFWPHNTSLWVTDFKGNHPKFIYHLYQVLNLSHYGTGSGVPTLNRNDIHDAIASVPSVDEQIKISAMLDILDKFIDLNQRKYDKLLTYKKAMLEKMFPKDGADVPEVRFTGFLRRWEYQEASSLFTEVIKKGYPDLPVLSATQDRGMVFRDETGKQIYHNKENEVGYKRVVPGQFVIHLRSFQGGFAHSAFEGITSPAYTVFGFQNSEQHDSYFWKYIFSSEAFIKRLETVTYGIRDGRSISYNEFLTLKLRFPEKREQQRIAEFFCKVDELIETNSQWLQKLTALKKALLDKMFV